MSKAKVKVATLEDVGNYVISQIEKVENDPKLTQMEKQYRIAGLLIGVGRHKDSLDYFGRAMDELRNVKDTFVWGDLYCTAGAMYANTLDYLGEVDLADQMFQELLQANPKGCHIGDYAIFLHKRKRDNKLAERLYKECIELYPNHSSVLLKFAGFMRHIRKDGAAAQVYYEKAIEANPENADALGNYASFVHGDEKYSEKCQDLYERAVKCDPSHTNNFCNYGLFLSEVKRQYKYAEDMYKHALSVAPKHSNTLYNYAVMLDTHCDRKAEAESFYRRALEVDAKHSYALYNLAVLLEEIALDRDGDNSRKEIASLYKRAVDADPRDAASAADYGRFLLIRFEDYKTAEPYLLRSISLDDESEVALYNLGLLNHKYKKPVAMANLTVALEMYRRLIGRSPSHLSGLLQLARLLVEINNASKDSENSTATAAFGGEGIVNTRSTTSNPEVDAGKVQKAWMEEVIELYEAIIPKHKEPSAIVCEYTKVVNKYGSARQKLRAIATAESWMRLQNSGGASESDGGDVAKIISAMKSANAK